MFIELHLDSMSRIPRRKRNLDRIGIMKSPIFLRIDITLLGAKSLLLNEKIGAFASR